MALRPASDPADVCDLLERVDLPTAGVVDGHGEFWVLEVDDGDDDVGAAAATELDDATLAADPIGCVGLERHADVGLLRSLAVHPDHRGRGHGSDLVRGVERAASDRGLERLYLLTIDAAGFFADLGYERVARESVPAPIRESEEFAELCPDSAVAMRRRLD